MEDLKKRLTQEELKSILHYDPISGEFHLTETNRLIGVNRKGRLSITINGLQYQASHIAWFYMTGLWPAVFIDHKDGEPSNNKFDNLRSATNAENARNRKKHKNNGSGFTGVYWSKFRNRWMARIRFEGKLKHIGCYDTPEEAAEAYEVTAKKLFGAFYRSDPIVEVRSRPTLEELGL